MVLDTNVLVAGLRSRRGRSFQILSRLGDGVFQIALSVPLLFEYEDVLARSEVGVTSEAASDILDYMCSVAHHQEVHFLWRPFLPDPKDDLVLEVAVASQSEWIVTFNERDFAKVPAQFGIDVAPPATFLEMIGGDK